MHGGDVYRNQVHMDFSVNVNPLGVPERVREAMLNGISAVQAYPDPLCEELKEKLAARFRNVAEHGTGGNRNVEECGAGFGCVKPENILCGNGASELLWAICRWKKPESALLLAPCFSGYEKALAAAGCKPDFFFLREEDDFRLKRENFDSLCAEIFEKRPKILFVANPANPTGVRISKGIMTELASRCGQVGTTMVIDECFMELTSNQDKYSMTCELTKFSNLLILRAFTKSFAIPGIRLGYLLCPDGKIAAEIGEQLPEWNVSVPAQLAGIRALREVNYLQYARKLISHERSYLARELEGMGARTFPSKANFLLFRWGDDELYEKLLHNGILIRDCSDYEGLGKGYYRIAVRKRAENKVLLEAVRKTSRNGVEK